VITCLSCVVFTDRHGSNVLLTYGTEQGSVRLCSKVVNTRNFKLIFRCHTTHGTTRHTTHDTHDTRHDTHGEC